MFKVNVVASTLYLIISSVLTPTIIMQSLAIIIMLLRDNYVGPLEFISL